MKKAKFYISFKKNYRFCFKPYLNKNKLLWKDKFDSPRCEREPQFRFEWLWFSIYGVWGDDHYWEQWLWLNTYCDGDYEKAKETWGWVDYDTKKSTWNDNI